ncbi:MAG: hypothetical protein U0169_12150 [Polyangiaceae bacterium]
MSVPTEENHHVRWVNGGFADVLRASANAITLASTIPSPPGSRIDGTLGGGEGIRVKIHGSKKQPDGTFVLDGRPIDLTREVREKLEALAGGPKTD